MNGSRLEETAWYGRLFLFLILFGHFSVPAQAQSWTNTSLPASRRAALLLNALTTDEKMLLVSGAGGPYVGNIPAIPRLDVPALTLQDGPAGVRVSDASTTALPAPITLAASWDTSLARQYGTTIGEEARGKGVMVQLGPMMNLARAYQAGRNFEGYGEDPALAGALAAATIQGIQNRGVIATAKHFVGNDQETQRTLVTSDVDERTLQEVYEAPFRDSIQAGAGAVMASYNRVNSRYACELEALNATLRKQWGFEGWVMSDWGAGFSAVGGMDNGLDMDMYSGRYTTNAILAALQTGLVESNALDGMVQHILTAEFLAGVFDRPVSGSLSSPVMSAAHTQVSRNIAAAGIVLLKNTGGLLPLTASVHSIAVIGSVAGSSPVSVGGGSASVNLPYNVTPLSGITSRAGAGVSVSYAQGDGASLSQAVQLATNCDVAIVCVGQATSEGSDRTSLSLPSGQDALVAAVSAANPRTIVALYVSSATLMPWADSAGAILAAWYPGQENGNALAQVLFGDVNPAGKLPVTLPASAGQVPTPTSAQFPGVGGHVSYSEELQIGYRWYDANNQTPLFPFGFGLSYTTFGYSNLTISAVSPSGQVQIGFDLTNTGGRAGSEVAQLYLGYPPEAGEPPRLLKDFQKFTLTPGQTQHVTFNLTWEELANWDATARGWGVSPGTFQVFVGASSRDIRLGGSFLVGVPIPSSDLANAARHQAVFVSSSVDTDHPGTAAVDGDPASCWISLAGDPQWLTVDLGLLKDLSRVRLRWGTNYASSYFLQTSSDNSTWQNVYTNTSGAGGVEDILVSGRARYIRLYAAQSSGGGGYSLAELGVYALPQRPYGGAAPVMPGRIQAENYDTGGQGVAYFNGTAGNPGGAYRSDDISIEATTDAGGGYDVASVDAGEWLEYTVSLPDTSAIYRISARVASGSGSGRLRARLNGRILGTVTIPNTGGGEQWQTVTFPDVPVQGGPGSQALKFEILSGGFSLNWFDLNRVLVCSTVNVAKGQSCSASSQESSSYPPSGACDGDITTRWSSAFSDPQWIQVDLGAVQSVARVRLIWENAFSRSYSVQVSTNGSAWSTVYATTNGAGSIDDLAAVGSARYVRIYSTQRATQYGNSLYEFEVYPAPQAASIQNIHPIPGSTFVDPSTPLSFTASSADSTIATNAVRLILNGIDVSSQLLFSGSATNWTVSFPLLLANGIYSAIIRVTNAAGQIAEATLNNSFDTFRQDNLILEAEDFDFGNGQFIDNAVPSSSSGPGTYFMQIVPAVWGVDLTTAGNVGGEEFAYRNDSCGTQVTTDFLRGKFQSAGVSDYNVGWWYAGAWLNYTRTFPTNNYYTYGRLSSGGGSFSATNSLVTAGVGTSSQSARFLGTFTGVGAGWQSWQWVLLRDAHNQPAVTSLGGIQTLKMTSGDSLNANFYMFVPVPPASTLSAQLINRNPVVSIPTQPGFDYQLVYKDDLAEDYWKLLNTVAGDGSLKTISDTMRGGCRYYRAVVQ